MQQEKVSELQLVSELGPKRHSHRIRCGDAFAASQALTLRPACRFSAIISSRRQRATQKLASSMTTLVVHKVHTLDLTDGGKRCST